MPTFLNLFPFHSKDRIEICHNMAQASAQLNADVVAKNDFFDPSKLIRVVHRSCMKFTWNFVLVIKNDELGPQW